MTFLVQFIRFRRGAPEVVRTLHLAAADASAALAQVMARVGTGSWPARTEAVRVMDDGGRTLANWNVPVAPAQRTAPLPKEAARDCAYDGPPRSSSPVVKEVLAAGVDPFATGAHRFEVGQPVSYAEDGKPAIWSGGFEIRRLCKAGAGEPQYEIRSSDHPCDRVVQEHELCEDLGARVRGR